MCRIENRMVIDSEWEWNRLEEAEEKLNGSGYKEIGTDLFVPEEDAFNYALEQCLEIVPGGICGFSWKQEFKEMLVEWFYSRNWVFENGRETYI